MQSCGSPIQEKNLLTVWKDMPHMITCIHHLHLTKFKCCIYRLYCNYGLLYIPLPHAPSLSWKQCSELVGVLEKTSQPSTAMKSWGPCFCMLDAIDELISHWTGIHKPDKRDIKNKQFAPFVFYNISLSSAWQFLSQGMNLEVIHAISQRTPLI